MQSWPGVGTWEEAANIRSGRNDYWATPPICTSRLDGALFRELVCFSFTIDGISFSALVRTEDGNRFVTALGQSVCLQAQPWTAFM